MATSWRHPDSTGGAFLHAVEVGMEAEQRMMWAARFQGPGASLGLERLPLPTLGPGEVLLRVLAAGVCHTELQLLAGTLNLGVAPLTLGHEIVGEVAALGEAAADPALPLGQRALVYYDAPCDECAWCAAGQEQLCPNLGPRPGFTADGGFAEYVRVRAANLVPLPGGLDSAAAAPLGCSAAAALHAVRAVAEVRAGETVLVYGIGAVGLMLVQLARLAGARVMAVGRSPAKLALARELGAELALDAASQAIVPEALRATANRGYDVVFEVVGSAETTANSLALLRRRGRLVYLGYGADRPRLNPLHLVLKELQLRGSLGNTRAELREVVRLAASGQLRSVVDRVVPLAEVNAALAALRRGEAVGRLVLDPGQAAAGQGRTEGNVAATIARPSSPGELPIGGPNLLSPGPASTLGPSLVEVPAPPRMPAPSAAPDPAMAPRSAADPAPVPESAAYLAVVQEQASVPCAGPGHAQTPLPGTAPGTRAGQLPDCLPEPAKDQPAGSASASETDRSCAHGPSFAALRLPTEDDDTSAEPDTTAAGAAEGYCATGRTRLPDGAPPFEAELLAFVSRGVDGPRDDAEFDDLARRLFAYQLEHNLAYRAFCERRGIGLEQVGHWSEIPAIPISAFKDARLACEPIDAAREFNSSGTTRPEHKSRHFHPSLAVYDLNAAVNFAAHLLPDMARLPFLILFPPEAQLPSSSLAHWLQLQAARYSADGGRWFVGPTGLDGQALVDALRQAEAARQPVCLLAASFALVHFLDYCHDAGLHFRLPSGSRLMDTGGYKGRSRVLPQAELYGMVAQTLGVPGDHLVNMYGLTEHSTQFLDSVLRNRLWGISAPRHKVPPPWARTRVLDPDTLQPLPRGELGLLCHFDLANRASVLAVLSEDLGYEVGDGFELVGRVAGTEARGCSIAVDELISAVRGG